MFDHQRLTFLLNGNNVCFRLNYRQTIIDQQVNYCIIWTKLELGKILVRVLTFMLYIVVQSKRQVYFTLQLRKQIRYIFLKFRNIFISAPMDKYCRARPVDSDTSITYHNVNNPDFGKDLLRITTGSMFIILQSEKIFVNRIYNFS